MELKPFRPDDKFFDDLVAIFEKEYISLDYNDILTIRRCKDITAFKAVKDSSFTGSADEFVDTFLKEVRSQIFGQSIDHVLVCIVPDNDDPILLETLSVLNDFMDIFDEETEGRWGLCRGKEGIPMQLIVAIGKES